MGVFGNGYIYKQPIRTLEESFNLFESEGNNYNKLFESINILAEANIKTAFQTIIQKIKDFFIWLGNKIKEIWNKIFHRHKATQEKAEEVIKQNEEIEEEINHLDEKKQELEDTKSRVISNIQARHNAAREEIKKSIENIKKNGKELDKQREKEAEEEADRLINLAKESKANKKPKLKVESKQEAKEKKFEYQIYDEYLASYLEPICASFETTEKFIEIVDQNELKDRTGNPYSTERLEELCSHAYERYSSQTNDNTDSILRSLSTERLQNLKDKEGNFEIASKETIEIISKLDKTLETCAKMKTKFEGQADKYKNLDISVSKEFAESAICQKYVTKCMTEDVDRIKKYLAALMNYTNAVESLKAKMVSQLDSINKQMATV